MFFTSPRSAQKHPGLALRRTGHAARKRKLSQLIGSQIIPQRGKFRDNHNPCNAAMLRLLRHEASMASKPIASRLKTRISDKNRRRSKVNCCTFDRYKYKISVVPHCCSYLLLSRISSFRYCSSSPRRTLPILVLSIDVVPVSPYCISEHILPSWDQS